MEVRISKGHSTDRVAIARTDGTGTSFDFPHKGPIPHDVVHLLVEQRFGLGDAFWGKVEKGCDPADIAEMAKEAGHASAKRAGTPNRDFVEIIQAERLVEVFEADLWSGGGDNATFRSMADAGFAQSLVPALDCSDEAIDDVRRGLVEFRDRWLALPVGETIAFEWPETATA